MQTLSARYNDTPTGRALTRLSHAIDALNVVQRQTADPFPRLAEAQTDGINDHIAAIRAKLTCAFQVLEYAVEPAPVRTPAKQTEAA